MGFQDGKIRGLGRRQLRDRLELVKPKFGQPRLGWRVAPFVPPSRDKTLSYIEYRVPAISKDLMCAGPYREDEVDQQFEDIKTYVGVENLAIREGESQRDYAERCAVLRAQYDREQRALRKHGWGWGPNSWKASPGE